MPQFPLLVCFLEPQVMQDNASKRTTVSFQLTPELTPKNTACRPTPLQALGSGEVPFAGWAEGIDYAVLERVR
jgi:hypothetical protein